MSRYVLFAALTVAALAPAGADAQGPAALEFSFSNPGARAMGFGGAFAGLADDATAAFANPAGLVQLLRPEVSGELRHWSYATPYNVGGRLRGQPTGIGLDTAAGLRKGTSHADLDDLSFLSFVYPSGRWSMAVYRHKLADFKSFFETQGVFASGEDGTGVRRFLDSRVGFELEVAGVGISCAYRPMESFSLGMGASRYEGSVASEVGSYDVDEPTTSSLFAPNHFLPERLVYRTSIAMDGTDWALSGGFLWRLAPRLSLGGFYRQGPEFEIHGVAIAGPGLDGSVPEGTVFESVRAPIALPDVYGLGLAYRSPDEHLTLGFEWDRVTYSKIVRSMGSTADWKPDQTLSDGDELHLGGEYALLESRPIIALRAGVWLDPDHRLRATGDDPLNRFYFQGGSDELHYALGLGFAFARFQVDLGIDFSRLVDTGSVSLIYSF